MEVPGNRTPDYPHFDSTPKRHGVLPGVPTGMRGFRPPKRRSATRDARQSQSYADVTRAGRRPAVTRQGPGRRARVRSRKGGPCGSRARPPPRASPARCRARPRCCAATARTRAGAAPCPAFSSRSPRETRRTARRGWRRRGRGGDRNRSRHWVPANRFHGHASWQSSHPKMRLPTQRPQRDGDRTVQLDGEVGDAQSRVEPVRGDDRPGRTCVDAGAAGPAVVGTRGVGVQGQIGVQLAEEEPGACGPVDEVGVLADPPEAGVAGERLLHDRGAVGEGTVAEGADLRLDMVGEALKTASDHLVVVAAERVARDIGEFRTPQHGLGVGSAAQIVHAHADDSDGSGNERRRPGAAHAMAGHVPEFAMIAGVEPCEQRCLVATPGCRR